MSFGERIGRNWSALQRLRAFAAFDRLVCDRRWRPTGRGLSARFRIVDAAVESLGVETSGYGTRNATMRHLRRQ
jgi:hypothetical protein